MKTTTLWWAWISLCVAGYLSPPAAAAQGEITIDHIMVTQSTQTMGGGIRLLEKKWTAVRVTV